MRAQLIETSPGTGKTRAAAEAVRRTGIGARIFAGNLALAREMAQAHGYNLIEGRSERNCERFEVVRALGEGGFEVEALACGSAAEPRCPARATCPYWRQFEAPGPRVGAGEQLFNRHFLAGGTVAVVDDADLGRTLIEHFAFTSDEMVKAHAVLEGKQREPLRRLLRVLTQALMLEQERTDSWRSIGGAAAWDRLARAAFPCDETIEAVVQRLPRAPSLPPPQADGAGVLTREAIEAAVPAKLLRLVRTLEEELALFGAGEDFNSRLRLSGGGLEVWRLREHMRDQSGLPLLPAMDLLVLDATPVRKLVDYLTRDHDRPPDVEAAVRLPQEVRVVQLATATNGHAVMREEENVNAVLSQIAAERSLHPVSPEGEGAVCFKALKKTLVESGFLEGQVATYGRMRGTNALAGVERLHLIGRPMPPGDDLVFLARVLHPNEAAVSEAMVLSPRRFGVQPFEVDVVDFADGRVAELLRSEREDEMEQALHRARIFALDPPQLRLLDGGEPKKRSELRLVLHTSHPVPGLRVDELLLASEVGSVNESRQADAERRIRSAKHRLEELCEPVTITAVSKLAKADKRTVARVLRTAVDTPKEDLLYKGLHRLPQATDKPPAPRPTPAAVSVPPSQDDGLNLCRGGCGKPMPPGRMCFECAAREAEEWARGRKRRRAG